MLCPYRVSGWLRTILLIWWVSDSFYWSYLYSSDLRGFKLSACPWDLAFLILTYHMWAEHRLLPCNTLFYPEHHFRNFISGSRSFYSATLLLNPSQDVFKTLYSTSTTLCCLASQNPQLIFTSFLEDLSREVTLNISCMQGSVFISFHLYDQIPDSYNLNWGRAYCCSQFQRFHFVICWLQEESCSFFWQLQAELVRKAQETYSHLQLGCVSRRTHHYEHELIIH